MKPWLLFALATTCIPAQAGCALPAAMHQEVREVFASYGGWLLQNVEEAERFEKRCTLLQQAGMAIQVYAQHAVLNGMPMGSATVFVKDAKATIYSADFAHTRTLVQHQGTPEVAQQLMARAVVQTFVQWPEDELKQAMQSLQKNRRDARHLLHRTTPATTP